jgi:hypothetical protein
MRFLQGVAVGPLFSRSESSNLTAIGRVVAFAGHVIAAGPWLYIAFTSTRHAAPDSVFMVALITGAVELLLFVFAWHSDSAFAGHRRASQMASSPDGWAA